MEASIIQVDTFLCRGDTLYFDGEAFIDDAVIAADTLRYLNGCDSLLRELELRFTQEPEYVSEQVLLCPGDSVVLQDGIVVTEAGTFDFITQFDGVACDSLILEVEVGFIDEAVVQRVDLNVCPGDSILVSDQWQTAAGIFMDTLESFGGCDSIIVITNLALAAEVDLVQEEIVLCENEIIDIGGIVIDSRDIIYDTLFSVIGCDSLITEYVVTESVLDFEQTEFSFEGEVGDTVLLSLDLDNIEVITWINEEGLSCVTCQSPELTLLEEGLQTYQVEIENSEGCIETLVVQVSAILQDDEISDLFYLPNILSNSTGNNTFFLQADADAEFTYDLTIYDRWGGVMFEKVDIVVNQAQDGWSPYQSDIESGVYVYYVLIGDETIVGAITVLK
jgi:hypothetical protein